MAKSFTKAVLLGGIIILGGCADVQTEDELAENEDIAAAKEALFQDVCFTGACTKSGLNCSNTDAITWLNDVFEATSWSNYGDTPCSDAWVFQTEWLYSGVTGESVAVSPYSLPKNQGDCENTTVTYRVAFQNVTTEKWTVTDASSKIRGKGQWDPSRSSCHFLNLERNLWDLAIGLSDIRLIRVIAQAKTNGVLKKVRLRYGWGY